MPEPIDVSIEYLPEWVDDDALVTPLGNDRYRLELQPMSHLTLDLQRNRLRRLPRAAQRKRMPSYGDIIEAREIGPGALRFVQVVERARFKRFDFFGSRGDANSPFSRMIDTVGELGGHWECTFGSCWLIFLPEDCAYDPKEALRAGDVPASPGSVPPPDAV
jgi:hypothetical protein